MKRKFYRDLLKKIYKQKRWNDRKFGKEKNEIVEGILKAKTEDEIRMFYEELEELVKQKRFREDFPTFSKFYSFVKKENLTFDDLRD